jgi:hypothetical protein
MILAILTVGCSFGLGEERNLQSRLAHLEAAEIEGIAKRLEVVLETPPGAESDDAGAAASVDASAREELALGVSQIRDRASRTRFRCAMLEADHSRWAKWKDVRSGSTEDRAHQAAYASMVYRNRLSAQVKREIYSDLAADLAQGVGAVGMQIAKRLPWWMRWGMYLAVAGAAAYGLLMLVGAYAVAVRRIARRRRIAFEQLDDEVERAMPEVARRTIALPPEARAEHDVVNAKRKKEGVR